MPRVAPRRATRWALGAVLAVAAVACSGGDDVATEATGPAPSTTAAPATTTTTVAAPVVTTATTAAPGDEGADAGHDELSELEEGHTALVDFAVDLLVGSADLAGQSFEDAGYTPTEGPGPCGTDLDADHPADVLVGTTLADADGRRITEEIRVFAGTDEAADAFEAHRGALACGGDGAGTTFGAATDVNDVVGADAASEVAVTSEDGSGVVITALVADTVLTFRIAAPSVTPSSLDPREVAAFGVGKILAALESAPAGD